MAKIRILYDDTISKKTTRGYWNKLHQFWESSGFPIDNQTIENFIATFVTNMVFQNTGLYWIIP